MKHIRAVLTFMLLCSILFILPQPGTVESAGTSLYVAPGASNMASCTRSDPCDFRHAIELVAQDGDVVYARSGTYTALDPSAVHLLQVYKSVTLYGSCSFDASTPVTCDTQMRNSVLDGENVRRVISAYGLGPEQIHIEGFTIVNGNASGMDAWCTTFFGSIDGCGGGIHAKTLQNLTLENITLSHNIGGDNGGLGGGLYAEDITYLAIENNTFQSNIAALSYKGAGGGALILDAGHQNPVIFKNNIIDGNETCVNSSSEDQWGAGLFIFESNGVQIVDNQFQNNNQTNQLLVDGSSIFFGSGSNLLIEHNQFLRDYGISVVHLNGLEGSVSGLVKRNVWWDNDVDYNLEILGPVTAIVENNFLGTRTVTSFGSNSNIFIKGGSSLEADVDILFNTFAASDYGVQIDSHSIVRIYNNIFTVLSAKAINVDISDASITRSISNNLFYNNKSDGDDTGTAGIFQQDPKLANISMGDFHLTQGSAAINRAAAMNFDIDIDGDHRPMGSGATPFDLGADEFVLYLYLPMFIR